MDDLRAKAIAAFADTVTVAATTPITAANFTATPLIRSAAAFNLSDLATLQGQLQKSPTKNLILDGNYKARIANQPGFFQKTGEGLNADSGYQPYGWNGIYLASNWTGAGANIKGPQCLRAAGHGARHRSAAQSAEHPRRGVHHDHIRDPGLRRRLRDVHVVQPCHPHDVRFLRHHRRVRRGGLDGGRCGGSRHTELNSMR